MSAVSSQRSANNNNDSLTMPPVNAAYGIVGVLVPGFRA